MTFQQNAVVVLIDAEDLWHALGNWPEDVCLASCLLRNGDCHFLFFRRAERAAIADRVMDVLDLHEQEICFIPEVPGFESREFKYSDERRLMALIASDPLIVHEAIDYDLNYTYAIEEGLDPAVVMGLPSRRGQSDTSRSSRRKVEASQEAPSSTGVKRGELSPLLPDFLRRTAEQSRRPFFSSVRNGRRTSFGASGRTGGALVNVS